VSFKLEPRAKAEEVRMAMRGGSSIGSTMTKIDAFEELEVPVSRVLLMETLTSTEPTKSLFGVKEML
jgi:hypothetical protein